MLAVVLESRTEQEESLEEKSIRLPGDGIKDQDVIRKICEEDLKADVSEICRISPEGLKIIT
jgi:hypothetical protein